MLLKLQRAVSPLLVLISEYQTLEKRLYSVSRYTEQCLYSDDKRAKNGNTETTTFAIQPWIKVLRHFLSHLPSQTMALEVGDDIPSGNPTSTSKW